MEAIAKDFSSIVVDPAARELFCTTEKTEYLNAMNLNRVGWLNSDVLIMVVMKGALSS